MKERLLTFACAIGALALFYTLFMPQAPRELEMAPPPTSMDNQRNGYAATVRWLESARVRVVSLGKRYEALRSDPRLTPAGNLLITTLPHRYPVRDREIGPLQQWLRAGNTVLVLTSLADTPDWTIALADSDLLGDLSEITGISFVEEADPRPAEQEPAAEPPNPLKPLDEPRQHAMAPNRPHPLFEGVQRVYAESEYPAGQWRAFLPYGGFLLSIAHDAQTGRDAFWLRNMGSGRMLISAYGSVFANEQLGRADNARLLANIVAQSVREGGAVIFDDHHQGVSELYDAKAFFSDSRLHTTLWLLLAGWLIWVLGSVALRGARPEVPALRETAFVEATGGLLARVTKPRSAAERMLELFHNDLRRRLSLIEDGQPLWSWLERQPRVQRSDLEALRAAHARLNARRSVDLVQLQNLLVRLQGTV